MYAYYITNNVSASRSGPLDNTADLQAELKHQKNLLLYLERNSHLADLLKAGKKYVSALKIVREQGSIGLPLCFRPELDLALITHISGELGSLLCQEPARAESLLGHVVVCALQELAAELPGGLALEHVFTPLCVACLPETCKLEAQSQTQCKGLALVRGILSALTTSAKYTRSCVVSCPVLLCPGAAGRRMRGGWVRGCSCRFCGVEEREVPGERDVGEEVVALMLPSGSLTGASQARSQASHITFRDDLVEALVLGASYEVVCRPAVNTRLSHCSLLACSKPRAWEPGALVRACQLGSYATPPSVRQLQNSLEHSPWALVWTMASQLGRDVLPHNTFLHLRLATLLSLASQGSTRPVPVLVCGGENIAAARLLASAASLAPRCVVHSSQNVIGGAGRRGEDGLAGGEGGSWMEAGSLLLASHGICLLGDWHALKKDAKSTVLACIESGQVTVQLPGKPLNFPLKAAIWTHCSHMPHKLLRPLIDVFGLPWLAETTDDENSELCNWLLQSAVCQHQPSSQDNLKEQEMPLHEIRELLSVVGVREVELSKEAGRLIRDYFVASRRARACGGASVEECLPIGAIQSMTALAEAHARLSLRAKVQAADAVAVIALYEHTMVAMFGPAFMTPPTPLTCFNTQVPLHCQVDEYLGQFSGWLQRYTQALLGDNEE